MKFAMVECSDGEWRPAIGGPHSRDRELVWRFGDGTYRYQDDSKSRPLVVIDPEDWSQVERLVKVIAAHAGEMLYDDDVDKCQDALREFANPKPPKPEEPKGRYAVVEDKGALEWVHADPVGNAQWKCLTLDKWRDYADIDVVRVLSEGVPE